MAHYRTVMQHYAQDRTLIVQAQRARMTKAPNAAEMEAALENLRKQQQASALAMGKGDYAAGNQALQGMEDALTAIRSWKSPFYGHFGMSPNHDRSRSFPARQEPSYYAAAAVASRARVSR
jgi:hypothetical protein